MNVGSGTRITTSSPMNAKGKIIPRFWWTLVRIGLAAIVVIMMQTAEHEVRPYASVRTHTR